MSSQTNDGGQGGPWGGNPMPPADDFDDMVRRSK
jgi:hypothetical protein